MKNGDSNQLMSQRDPFSNKFSKCQRTHIDTIISPLILRFSNLNLNCQMSVNQKIGFSIKNRNLFSRKISTNGESYFTSNIVNKKDKIQIKKNAMDNITNETNYLTERNNKFKKGGRFVKNSEDYSILKNRINDNYPFKLVISNKKKTTNKKYHGKIRDQKTQDSSFAKANITLKTFDFHNIKGDQSNRNEEQHTIKGKITTKCMYRRMNENTNFKLLMFNMMFQRLQNTK